MLGLRVQGSGTELILLKIVCSFPNTAEAEKHSREARACAKRRARPLQRTTVRHAAGEAHLTREPARSTPV